MTDRTVQPSKKPCLTFQIWASSRCLDRLTASLGDSALLDLADAGPAGCSDQLGETGLAQHGHEGVSLGVWDQSIFTSPNSGSWWLGRGSQATMAWSSDAD
jgi:hypothetical protein